MLHAEGLGERAYKDEANKLKDYIPYFFHQAPIVDRRCNNYVHINILSLLPWENILKYHHTFMLGF